MQRVFLFHKLVTRVYFYIFVLKQNKGFQDFQLSITVYNGFANYFNFNKGKAFFLVKREENLSIIFHIEACLKKK